MLFVQGTYLRLILHCIRVCWVFCWHFKLSRPTSAASWPQRIGVFRTRGWFIVRSPFEMFVCLLTPYCFPLPQSNRCLTYDVNIGVSSPIVFLPFQDLFLNLQFTVSVRLAGQQIPGVWLFTAVPKGWGYGRAPPGLVSCVGLGALPLLAPACFSKHYRKTTLPFSPWLI